MLGNSFRDVAPQCGFDATHGTSAAGARLGGLWMVQKGNDEQDGRRSRISSTTHKNCGPRDGPSTTTGQPPRRTRRENGGAKAGQSRRFCPNFGGLRAPLSASARLSSLGSRRRGDKQLERDHNAISMTSPARSLHVIATRCQSQIPISNRHLAIFRTAGTKSNSIKPFRLHADVFQTSSSSLTQRSSPPT